MEVRLLENKKKENKLAFVLKNSNPAFANMLRRTIVEEVPTMAIEDVELKKNSSILYDEMIAHRLGLIPLSTDLSAYNLPEECKCNGEGCSRCTLKLVLKSKGPGIVFAEEMQSMDPKVKPVFPKTPIVKLMKGQSLEFEATAVLGKGKEHTKWTPGLAWYKYKPVVEVSNSVKDPKTVADSCPVDVFQVKNSKLQVNKDNLLKCHLCANCVETDPKAVKLNETDDEFVFYIESFGQLAPKKMVEEAIKIINSKVDFISKSIK